MPLLNYTTQVAADRSLAEITRCLVAHGARGVMVEYGADRQPSGIAFMVPTAFGDRSFQLPARIAEVEKTLKVQHRRGKLPPRFATRDQAARVAWRILKDWIEAQLAIVETGMTTLDEIMLPFMLGAQGRTVYQVMQDRQMALPGPGHG